MRRAIPMIVAGMLAACMTAPEGRRDQATLDAEVAARQGEQVDRICFTREIDGWRALGEDAVLLEKGVNDWYKLDLAGTCEPEWAFETIALRTRPAGSLCVSEGDAIQTLGMPGDGTCFISAIHEWDEDAAVADARTD